MLLDITPNGNEIQRKMLLNHSNNMNIAFLVLLLLIPISIFIGVKYSTKGQSNEDAEGYYIQSVVRGNTLVLNNGAQVELLGIAPDWRETQEELSMLEGGRVIIVPDSSAPFDEIIPNNKVYGYVSLEDEDYCINSELLKSGKANLVITPILRDSLDVYKEYARNTNSIAKTQYESQLDYSEFNFDPTQYTLSNEPIPVRWSYDPSENIKVLEQACKIDDCTKNFANQLAARSPGSYHMAQVCEIFNYCYNNWRYVNDPSGQEYLASSSQSIASHLVGDCDDFAVLMASCVLAIGGNPSVILAFNANSGHAYAEVEISSMDIDDVRTAITEYYPDIAELAVRTDTEGRQWLNLDWSANHPGGDYWNSDVEVVHTCIDSQWNY